MAVLKPADAERLSRLPHLSLSPSARQDPSVHYFAICPFVGPDGPCGAKVHGGNGNFGRRRDSYVSHGHYDHQLDLYERSKLGDRMIRTEWAQNLPCYICADPVLGDSEHIGMLMIHVAHKECVDTRQHGLRVRYPRLYG